MTDDEVLALLQAGNESRNGAAALYRQAYDGAETEVAKCWAAHLVAVASDLPTEKLDWNLESLRAAEAAADDPRASGLFPTVLSNIGYSTLLLARPREARAWYERAMGALSTSSLDEGQRRSYDAGITHMLGLIDGALSAADPDART